MHNYNTTNGQPYIRVSELNIKYGSTPSDLIKIEGFEKLAVILPDQSIFIGEGLNGSFSKIFSNVDLATGNFPLINTATGEETGATMTNQELFVAFTSFIRKIQKEPR